MNKFVIMLALALAFVAGCKNRNQTAAADVENSLDYAGVYLGTIPCADCAGIRLTISIDHDGNFIRTMKYLTDGDDNMEFTDRGASEVDKNQTVLTLGEDKYRIGPGTLTVLDPEGNFIEGILTELYVLKKQI